jgi:hypothetical protein
MRRRLFVCTHVGLVAALGAATTHATVAATTTAATTTPASAGTAAPAAASTLTTTGCTTPSRDKVRVLVLDLKAPATDAARAAALSSIVVAEAGRVPGFTLLSARELQAAIAHEADRQRAGCDDDTGCLAEVADAVDADLLVHGSLDAVDGAPVVSLTLLNTRALVVVNRVTFPWRGSPDALADVALVATQHLVLDSSQRPPGTVRVTGLPAAARVFVDGQDRTTDAHGGVLSRVPTGPHEVQVTIDGMLPSTSYVIVKGGETVTVQPVLEPAPVPGALLWGGAAAVAVVGVGATLGVVWATTRANASLDVLVPAYDLHDVETLRSTR